MMNTNNTKVFPVECCEIIFGYYNYESNIVQRNILRGG